MRMLAAFFLLVAGGPAPAAPGTTGANLLKVEVGARGQAMGGAFTALPGDLGGVLANPALASPVGGRALMLAHWPGIAGLTTDFLSYGLPLGGVGSWAGTVLLRQFPQIDTDVSGEDPVDVNDGLLMMTFARRVTRAGGHAGVSVKLFNTTIGTQKATSLALDAGALGQSGGKIPLRFGVAVLNVGNPIKNESVGERLPLAVRGGMSWSRQWFPHQLTAAADLKFDVEQNYRAAGGLEWVQTGRLALRAGGAFSRYAPGTVAFGAGWRFRSTLLGPEAEYFLDYAYVPFAFAGGSQATHSFSVFVKF
ncbi:MAG: hypothetical protein AAB368_09865 [bacterium]